MSIIWLVWSAARIMCHQSLQPRRIRCWRQILKDPPSNSTSPSCECPPPCAFLHAPATHHLCQKICWHVSVSVAFRRNSTPADWFWPWQPCFSAATQLVSERFLLHLQRCFSGREGAQRWGGRKHIRQGQLIGIWPEGFIKKGSWNSKKWKEEDQKPRNVKKRMCQMMKKESHPETLKRGA